MRTLTFAALLLSLGLATTPIAAQRIEGNRAGTVRGAPVMQARGGGWNAPRPAQGGNWSGPRSAPSHWNNNPRPNPGAWNGPRPNRPGNWNNTPRPTKPGTWNNHPRPNPGNWNHSRPSRWGNKIGGHWYAGHNAPGGWKGYHRPYRGWTLPSYWIAPSFYISDYSSYGLSAPPYGYNWTRYYDDAVLMDQRGQVWDSVSGLDWDRYDDGYAYDDGYYDDGQGAYYGEQGYYQQRDNGVGGAIIGGVAGGVAGNLIGGRGDRTAGTLIGAGVGAVAGYAIDKAEDRGRYDGPSYGAGYPAPPVVYGQPAEVVQGGGYTYQQPQQGGYVSGGYWYPPVTTTTVTVSQAPAVITTTTEYIDTVTYTSPRKTYYKKKAWRPKTKVRQCACQCRC